MIPYSFTDGVQTGGIPNGNLVSRNRGTAVIVLNSSAPGVNSVISIYT